MSATRPGPHRPLAYALLFLPWVLAALLEDRPSTSYAVAWLGSWAILYLTLSGRVRELPGGLPWHGQLLRPFGFTQIVFAGYTCLTSVFFVLDLHGFRYFAVDALALVPAGEMDGVAAAQRYYVLGHASVAAGMLAVCDYRSSGRWRLRLPVPLPAFLLGLAAGVTIAGSLLPLVALGQVAARFQQIALVASVLALARALPRRHLGASLLGASLFAYNLLLALLSGWKEEVIVIVVLLGVFLYPQYRRAVLLGAPVALALMLLALPTYNQTLRKASWFEGLDPRDAAALGVAEIRAGGSRALLDDSWTFLRSRSTEIGLFTRYLEHTPDRRPFYGTRLAGQSLEMLVPRVFWPSKPSTERLVMERVYENGVVSSRSSVSAKPQYLVDGYLSAGALGVLLAGLLFGTLATLASRLAERWFGGYLIGSGLAYTALFTTFWRGNSFEFLFNTVLWSFVLMVALAHAGRVTGWLVPARTRRRYPSGVNTPPATVGVR